ILRMFERISKRAGLKSFIALVLITIFVVTVPLLVNTSKKADLVIGAKLGAEPTILINMYKLLIEDQTDLKVELIPNLGKTSFNFKALQEGSIDIYPEFTGTVIVELLGEQAESNDAYDVYIQAKEGLSEQYDMAYLEPMQFNNTYTVATTEDLADQYGLEEIDDLQKVEDRITAGFTLEFKDRYDGYVGMQDVYNIDIADMRTMDPGIRQEALENGDVDVIDAYATDSYMIDLNLKTLDDPEQLFPPYQGAPLMKQATLDKYPELEAILNELGGKITDKEMREMNYEVDYNDQSPYEVAKAYLIEHRLIKQ